MTDDRSRSIELQPGDAIPFQPLWSTEERRVEFPAAATLTIDRLSILPESAELSYECDGALHGLGRVELASLLLIRPLGRPTP